jgi:hypothetical protein
MRKQERRSALVDKEPPKYTRWPAHIARSEQETHPCSILLFVPRNLISALIDDFTGRYGYSHTAIDTGEVDAQSGKPVMIEATPFRGVHYSFQDEYGERKMVRIPVEKAGINPEEFCNCIRAKVGEKYDDEEALTFGILDNPAKQICSDLVTVCLPEQIAQDIANQHRSGRIHPFSAVRINRDHQKAVRLFISPNGFAEYFGAPRGKQVEKHDQPAASIFPPK